MRTCTAAETTPGPAHETVRRVSPSSDSITMVLIVGLRTTSTVPVRFISKRVVSVRCENLRIEGVTEYNWSTIGAKQNKTDELCSKLCRKWK